MAYFSRPLAGVRGSTQFHHRVSRAAEKTGGLVLLGMRERAEMIGGTLRVDSAAGGPTTVQVRIAAGKARARKPAPPPPGEPGAPT